MPADEQQRIFQMEKDLFIVLREFEEHTALISNPRETPILFTFWYFFISTFQTVLLFADS